jgi:hypothetical protein
MGQLPNQPQALTIGAAMRTSLARESARPAMECLHDGVPMEAPQSVERGFVCCINLPNGETLSSNTYGE